MSGYDDLENKILNGQYTLHSKVLYGGLFHGIMVMPNNLSLLVTTILFPPFGEICNSMSNKTLPDFPYITWDALIGLFNGLPRIIISFILTCMFYVPGLIYSLANIKTDKTINKIFKVSKS